MDDGFLLFGLLCLVSGTAILFIIVDTMYEFEALTYSEGPVFVPGLDVPALLARAPKFHSMAEAVLILMWLTICSVKLSFLAFFKRLVRQMPRMEKYWWFALIFNILGTCFGAVAFWAGCPYFTEDTVTEGCESCILPETHEPGCWC